MEFVREQRKKPSRGRISIGHKKISWPIFDYSSFGFSILAGDREEIPEDGTVVEFKAGEATLSSVRVKRIYSCESGNSRKTGYQIITEPLNVRFIETFLETEELIHNYHRSFSKYDELPEGFRSLVLEMKHYLEGIRSMMDNRESEWKNFPSEDRKSAGSGAEEILSSILKEKLPFYYQRLSKMLNKLAPDKIKLCIEYFRSQLAGIIYEAPFAYRSYYKPLGYAGDYNMMSLIYGDKYEGMSVFSRSLHKYYIDQPAAQAVKNRARYLYNKMNQILIGTEEAVRILSVAAGPAYEIRKFIRTTYQKSDYNIEFTLLDQDLEALQFAKQKLRETSWKVKKMPPISYVNMSIRRVIAQGMSQIGEYDFIFSAGLFDYFSDPVARMVAKKLFERLKEGGLLIIGNFDGINPTRPIMEVALDWKLNYRTAENMGRLFQELKGEVTIEREETHINIFYNIRKPKR